MLGWVLGHVEVVAVVETDVEAHFFWERRIEFSHDCFVCRRRGRTVVLNHGEDEGRCVSAHKPSDLVPPGVHSFDEVAFVHPAPIRVAAFDTTTRRIEYGNRQTLRCRLTFWWAPFQDVKHPEDIASALTSHPWVRLSLGLGCRSCYEAGHQDALRAPGHGSIQTNTQWPKTTCCPNCERKLLTAETGPAITMVE
jgi:hypothetical protein